MRARSDRAGLGKRTRAVWGTATEIGGGLYAIAFMLVLAAVVLMLIGVGVRDLSELLGMPLSSVDRNPNGIEWRGLGLLLLYGCAGAAALFASYEVGRRVLHASVRGHVGRAVGAVILLAVAAGAALVALEDWDLTAATVAVGAGYAATRVSRGLPFDDEEEPALPASFDAPVKLVNEEPTTRVESWTKPPQRPFVLPTARDPGSGRPSHADPIEGDHDPRA
jgi:hypothetical protein